MEILVWNITQSMELELKAVWIMFMEGTDNFYISTWLLVMPQGAFSQKCQHAQQHIAVLQLYVIEWVLVPGQSV